jgi:hypothetical protein
MTSKGLQKKWRALDRKDRRLLRRFLPKEIVKLVRGELNSFADVEDDAEAAIKVKAVNWPAILEFIQALQPIIEDLIAMSEAE